VVKILLSNLRAGPATFPHEPTFRNTQRPTAFVGQNYNRRPGVLVNCVMPTWDKLLAVLSYSDRVTAIYL